MRDSHGRLLSERKSINEKIKSSGWTVKLPTLRVIMTSNNKKKVPLVITEENNKPKLKMRRMVLGSGHYLSPGGGGGSEDFGLYTMKFSRFPL